ncbi:MAG: SdrD B-like domain-containing protein, partial [Methanothrix sp.]|nr:SdrD B-like domain-containing protein [Methanothrix sp.]
SWTASAEQVGQHVIEARVRDGKHNAEGDGTVTANFEIALPPNNAPVMSSLTADKDSPQVTGTAITWTAAASDPENDPLQFQFSLDGQVVQDWSDSSVWSWTASAEQVGQHVIEARVRDGKHNAEGDGTVTANFEIALPPNNAPALSSLTADKDSPQVTGTAITWTAQASDPESDPISYRFLVNGTPATEWQSENLWTWIAEQSGTSQILAQVKDSLHAGPQGEGGNMSREFSINAPAPVQEPVAVENVTVPEENKTEPLPPVPETVVPPVTENITTPIAPENATQPEQPVNETETVPIAPETVVPPATENITTPIVPENVTENVTVPLQPANETEPAPVAVNQTPVLDSLTADVTSPQIPGTTITWTAEATDADSDPLLYRFFQNGPATSAAWQPVTEWSDARTWTQKTSSADVGENQVKVQIRDGKHADEDGFDGETVAFFTISEPAMNISGSAYDDKNGNGLLDSGEALAGWTIRLAGPEGEISALTSEDGSYRFERLLAGSYTVSETLPSGWKPINPESGSYSVDLKDADVSDRNFVNKLTSYSISGMKYNDLDGNGANDGEPGMADWKITLSGTTQSIEAVQKELTTAKDGSYKFEGISPGTYTITETEQSGWVRTAPVEGSYSIALSDADITGKDFGNHGSWAISGSVFLDRNGNGARDADETGQVDWSIQISQDGKVINATTTGQDGSYAFKNLAPGKYTVSEVASEGWTISLPQEGSYSVDLLNADVTGKDFGNRGDLSISGQKYYDINGNGVQDADEPGIPGGEVSLVESGKTVANTTTDDNGMYSFKNILPGTYTINDPVPSGLILTTSSSVIVTVKTNVVVNANFGLVGSYAISGMKYNDKNDNKVKDTGEAEPGWDIVLTGTTWFGKPLHARTTTTGADGTYKFDKLIPGTYKVSETSRTGWTQIAPASGSYTITFPFGAMPSESKNNDFGNKVVAQSISGVKYNDINKNSARDAGEPGLEGWTINLEKPAGTVIQTKTTAADGSYSFTGLDPGTYVITEVQQAGWTQKSPAGGKHTVTLDASTTSAIGKDFGNFNNNLPPKDPTLTPNKNSPQRAGTPIVWTAGATDPDGDALQFRFFVKGPSTGGHMQPQTDWTAANVWTWSTGVYAAGSYQIEVRIRDGKHEGPGGSDAKKTASFTLTSANLPPRVNVLFSDRPAPQYVGSWIKWTALASDPEGDPLQYKFYLRGPSTNGFWIDQTGWGKNNRWIWRTNALDTGNSQVLVAVRDGSHAGPGGSDDYEIAGYSVINLNLPPVITSLASNMNSPQPIGATVWWKASAMDPEGNPVFYRYWVKGPATGGFWRLARDWSTDPTWVWPTSTADAGTSEIQVQVRDGLHSSPAGWDDDAGALFTVLRPNQPPTLISLKSDRPSSQIAGTPIKWTAVASDPDREAVFYKFWLKGPSTAGAWKVVQDWSTKSQWTWVSSGSDGGAYTVYVYARDGKHNPATGYDSAMGAPYILSPNQPPKLTALTADKKSPQSAGTAVKWTATATDANKDPILYRFWLKGPSTAGAWKVAQDWSTKNQWTWVSSSSDSGDYTVYVYARDGKHSSATSYDSALGAPYQLTANEPPKLAALVPDKLSPQSAGTAVKWTAMATDTNNDPILYQFWLKGPTTGNAWKVVADWSTKNQWTWTNAPTDAGSYVVFVYARDGKHAPATAYDSAVGQDYTLLNMVASKKVAVIGRSG